MREISGREGAGSRFTGIQWLVIGVACIGFAFDLYETLMLALLVRPAVGSLGGLKPGTASFNLWVGLLFYIPNVAAGIFGLLGGYLADLFGRKRVLVLSILLYCAGACGGGFSTSLSELLFFRCVTLIGVSVEFVVATTWLAELFTDSKQRDSILAYTQAFYSIGGLMVAGAYYLAVTYGEWLPMVRGGHEAWRYTLLSGMAPALPLLVIRPFLPESELWKEKKAGLRFERPRLSELFQPALRRTTLVATLLLACTYALPLGAIQHTVRIVPGLTDVRDLSLKQVEQRSSGVQVFQELGGMTGRILFAAMVVHIASQRHRALVFFTPCLIVFPFVYFFAATRTLAILELGIFLATMLFNGLHSFWGNYLPRVYPTRLRGTGESFAANIGGRAIGVSAALMTTSLSNVMPGARHTEQLAYAAGTVAGLFSILGLMAIRWLPEPSGDCLPD
jgi:MFS family permease